MVLACTGVRNLPSPASVTRAQTDNMPWCPISLDSEARMTPNAEHGQIAPPKGAVSGRLTLDTDFTLNEEGLVLRCPNNVEPVSASLAKAKLQARFDLSICQKCPDILRCPVQAAKRDGQFSRFQYTPARAANQKRRLYEQSDAFRDVYRWRAGIEATMSRLKYQMNLAHLRIRGMPAMRYVVNLRALGLNIRRCAAIAP